MPKFRKKPIVVEAIQFTGANLPPGVEDARVRRCGHSVERGPHVHTPEGPFVVSVGDWIIKGVKGEFYPCKPDIFAVTYEAVEEVARG